MKMLNLGCGRHYHRDWTNVDFLSTGEGVIACDLKMGLPFVDHSFHVVYHSHLLEHFPKFYAPVFLNECFRVLRPNGIIRVVVPDLEQIVRLYLEYFEKALTGDMTAKKRYDWLLLELFDQMVRNKTGGEMFEYWQKDPIPEEAFVMDRLGTELKNALKDFQKEKVYSTDHNENHICKNVTAREIGEFRLSGEVHQWMYDRYSLGQLLKKSGFQDIEVCKANESAISDFNSYFLDIEPNGSIRKPDSLFMEARKKDNNESRSSK